MQENLLPARCCCVTKHKPLSARQWTGTERTGLRPPSSMSSLRSLLSASALAGAVVVGYGMWSIIAPGEERRKELIKVSPGRPARCGVQTASRFTCSPWRTAAAGSTDSIMWGFVAGRSSSTCRKAVYFIITHIHSSGHEWPVGLLNWAHPNLKTLNSKVRTWLDHPSEVLYVVVRLLGFIFH